MWELYSCESSLAWPPVAGVVSLVHATPPPDDWGEGGDDDDDEQWSSVVHTTWEYEQKKTHGYRNELLEYPHWKLRLPSFYLGKGIFLDSIQTKESFI